MLARVARLPRATRELLELLAVVLARAETALLDTLRPAWPDEAAPAEERGMVALQAGALTFRHELARRAVEQALPASRARSLHSRVLVALRAGDADPARLVHHAEQSGHTDTLMAVAPIAAQAAAVAGAHREAAAHYRRALGQPDRYPPVERAALLEAYTVEASTTCHLGEALRAAEKALELRGSQDDLAGVGRNLRWMSWLSWLAGQREEMDRRLTGALEVLETLPPGPDLAMAYSDLAVRIALYGGQREEAEQTAARAVELAEGCGDSATLIHVLSTLGILPALLHGDDTMLRQSLDTACAGGLHFDAGWTYLNLARLAALRYDRDAARRWITEGIAYVEARDILGPLQYLRGLLAEQQLDDGDWARAEATAHWVLDQPEGRGVTGVHALATLARVQTRRGRLEEAADSLRHTWTVSETCGLLLHVAPAACALAEHAWLTGNWEDALDPLRQAHAVAARLQADPLVAETGFWLATAGEPVVAPEPAAGPATAGDPYRLRMAGDWWGAARIWQRRGCPYEQAQALADADDEKALLTALEICDGLEASPLAARIRARLRTLGVHRVPRGPLAATRAHPAGLTQRQVDVLALVAQGLTDAEIAERLVVSVRTVNHHVAAVLDKLGVDNRRDAVRAAARVPGGGRLTCGHRTGHRRALPGRADYPCRFRPRIGNVRSRMGSRHRWPAAVRGAGLRYVQDRGGQS
ncbi:helix-turn-helix transcriptional regulator [Pseudonocardia sp. H11422]|uniref:helix-turn-helix transcriptional regulator n=1 Tax=Pseudonocardia sp. H11422 TaxID=2835866 RepID=UPI001BDD23D6|nr:LuxR C-terminal-related transcriptional regulator [Pseudonocardia sp. H11422]